MCIYIYIFNKKYLDLIYNLEKYIKLKDLLADLEIIDQWPLSMLLLRAILKAFIVLFLTKFLIY